MSRSSRFERGSALMTSVLLISVMLVVTAGVLYFAGQERRRAIQRSRSIPRNYCVETGLQMARAYFGANFDKWNTTYLNDRTHYDPVPSSCAGAPANPGTDPPNKAAGDALQTLKPWLFADLDGDGVRDVYIYIRDNFDEFPPAAADCTRDNDLQVIVGAVCVSTTLAPLREDGTVNPIAQTAEAILQYSPPSTGYSQRSGGASGNANSN